jgi:hypothetical protein
MKFIKNKDFNLLGNDQVLYGIERIYGYPR